MNTETLEPGCVMVVDDEEQNRFLLREILEADGHQVSEANDGGQAMTRIRDTIPDVVLLDVMMPVVTGIDVCRHVKADPLTAHIPILMVTSLSDRETRLLGIQAGANDFLSKPIDRQDVLLRVRNAIFAHHLYKRLQNSYERLQMLEGLRDNLTHLIVHDLRSPLTGISAYLQLLEMGVSERLNPNEISLLRNALSSTTSLNEMIGSILDVNRMESGEFPLELSRCNLAPIAADAVRHLEPTAQMRKVRIEIGSCALPVDCDATIVKRILTNLAGNALKFTDSGGSVNIAFEQQPRQIKVMVTDTGQGIPAEKQPYVFDKFFQVKARKEHQMYSTGLGLTFCKLAVEAHGGRIGVSSEPGTGSCFWFTLPLVGDAQDSAH